VEELMMPAFKELLLKKAKEGKFLSEEDKAAKMDVLNGIKDIMSGEMGKTLSGAKGMKKVIVASPTEEGLKEGLDVAEDKLEEGLDSESEDEESCQNCQDSSCPECKMKGNLAELSQDGEPSKADKIKKLEAELAMLKGDEAIA